MVWVIVSCVIMGVLLLAVWPALLERRRRPIGPDARHGAEGEFALLSQGVTHYRWTGSSRGPVAVLIHGLASPMVTVEAMAKGLGEDGYRVLMYDLYGRGLSDAPDGLQNRAFFLRQLSDLLALHNLKDDITLAGYSMGGAIATAYAAEHPDRVKQVLLVASSGIMTNESGFSRFCKNSVVLGAWVHGVFAEGRIKKTIPLHGETKAIDKVLRSHRRELKRRGYLPSLLSSRRGILSEIQEREHRKLGRQGIRVCAIWAGDDKIVPLQAIGKLAEWNRAAQQEVVARADHALPYTHGEPLIVAMRAILHPT